MKYLFYIVFTVIISLSSASQASDPGMKWDDSKIARVAMALREKPEELRDFLEMVTRSTEGEKTDTEEPFRYALKPLHVKEQISLSASDVIMKTPVAKNFQNVYEIDLSDLDFNSPGIFSIFDYFERFILTNLRFVNLHGTTNTKVFIDHLFGPGKSKKYFSLLRIDASSSSIDDTDLLTIFNHFITYECFIRDMFQYSERYGTQAAVLSVETSNSAAVAAHNFARGAAGENVITIYHRVEKATPGRFILMDRRT